jgi:MoaA/NifB/PqqE/SkfB family radical SAM enzyme
MLNFFFAIAQKCKSFIEKRRHTLLNYPFGDEPLIYQIETTTLCNSNCLACTRRYYPNNLIGSMSVKYFKKLLNILPNLKVVNLQGMGEPFLTPDFQKMLVECKKRKLGVQVISNGTIFKRTYSRYIDSLIISLNAFSKKKYQELHGANHFELVIKNVKSYAKIRTNQHTAINFVRTKLNQEEYPKIKRFASSVGIKDVWDTLVENWDPFQRENFEKLKVKNINKRRCFRARRIPFITWQGLVTPCCIRMDPRIKNFGNLFKDFSWDNQEYQKFLQDIERGQFPPFCQGCPS